MKHSRNPLYSAVQYALLPSAVAGFALASSPAMAQEAEGEDSATLDRVQVTGSRISRVDIEGANPVTTLSREDIQRSGFTDLGELMQELPSVTGSPVSTQRNNGGNGSISVDIRGLSSVRTLVLVNGRRMPTLGNDLSQIPIVMVERVEVLKDGASAIYGADAVAGVVNIITRRDFEGAEFEFQIGESFDAGGSTYTASFITGGNSERGNFVVGMEYSEIDPVFQGDLDEYYMKSAVGVYDFDEFAQYGSGGGINQDLDGDGYFGIVSFGSSRVLNGRYNLTAAGLGSSWTICTGEDGRDVSDFGPRDGVCGPATYDFAPVNYIQTPYERTSFFFQSDYELFDGVNSYLQANFNNRHSEQLLAPLPYDTRFDPSYANDPASGGAVIAADNAYNPFGAPILEYRRRMAETGGRNFNQDIDVYQMVFGLTGDFGATWTWDVSFNYGKSDRADTDFGQFYGPNLTLALGPSFFDDSGTAICGTPTAPIDGCVPLNAFSTPDVNPMTPEMLAYVSIPLNDRYVTQRQVFNATVVGDLFEMPAGPVGAAFGYEYRDEQYTFTPDSAKTADQTTGNTGAGTDGGYDVDSFFAEFAVPLLSDVPGAELLELNISARYDDFSTFGNTTNVQYGLRWQPVRSLLIRGTFSEVFREPNVSELFAGQGDSFPNASDPCNTSNIGSLNSAGQAQCSADGVPAGGYAQSDVQVRARVGGNPNLGPEEGDTTTFGLAWSPEFLDGFSATVDYWEVELENAITALGASTVLDECYRNQHPTLCNNITRLPGGNLNAVETLQQNISTETATGWDFAANYNMNTDIGLWKFRWLGTLLDEREQVVPGAIPLDAAGRFEARGAFGGSSNQGSFPEWRHNVTVDWAMGDFEASLSMAYIGEMKVCGDDNFGFAGCPDESATHTYSRFDGTPPVTDQAVDFTVDEVIYFDLVGRYTFSDWGTELAVGIQNVTDEEPPFIHQGFNSTTDPDTYRMLGRTWFFNVKQSF